MTVFSSFGYWRIDKLKPATAPTSRISRLTTIDSTGRRMKISVTFIARAFDRESGSVVRKFRRERQGALVVGRDRGAVEEHLVLTKRHHRVPGLEPAENGDAAVDVLACRHRLAFG